MSVGLDTTLDFVTRRTVIVSILPETLNLVSITNCYLFNSCATGSITSMAASTPSKNQASGLREVKSTAGGRNTGGLKRTRAERRNSHLLFRMSQMFCHFVAGGIEGFEERCQFRLCQISAPQRGREREEERRGTKRIRL